MKREILFRGKRKDNNEWVEGDYLQHEKGYKQGIKDYIVNNMDCNYDHEVCIDYEVIPETVGQYTGLKDNKRTKEFPDGQRIFEGDIVEGFCPNDFSNKMIAVIKYSDDNTEEKDTRRIVGFNCNFTDAEIIGNTTDNPELLKKEVK